MKIVILDLYVKQQDPARGSAERIAAALGGIRPEVVHMTHPSTTLDDIMQKKPQGIIISGSNTGKIAKHRGYRITHDGVDWAAKKGIPLLGICAGYQLLGRHYGHDIGELDEPEIGWREVRLTAFGKLHPLFHGIPDTFRFYQHHKRYVEGIRHGVIAKDSAGSPQAVVFQPQVYGVQFHPEVPLDGRTSRSLLLDNFVFYATHRKRPIADAQPRP